MKIAILGYGVEGQAAYEYWAADNDITICDRSSDIAVPSGVATRLGEHYLADLDQFDVIVRSPNIHPRQIDEANSPDILVKVTSNTNEFLRVCPTANIIGVTGTKGKGTTSTLIATMLQAAGKRVHLGGNIGVATLELLKADIQPADYVVLELSSFQLIDLHKSPRIAVCLMVVPEHMDWHEDFEEYVAAKQQLFIHQTAEDTAIYFAGNEDSLSIADASEGQLIPYFEQPGACVIDERIVIDGHEICKTSELKLLGSHNWQNVCAAVTAVWQVSQDTAALRSVLTSFSGLPYRLEFVRELNGVKYYNDSFGTTPETAIVALQAFAEPKVIILGGSTKGADFTALAGAIAKCHVRQVIIMGNTANPDHRSDSSTIEAALRAANVTDITSLITAGGPTTEQVVQAAQGAAQPGDVVVLSAGCASFDMYRDYKDRGSQFTEAVRALALLA